MMPGDVGRWPNPWMRSTLALPVGPGAIVALRDLTLRDLTLRDLTLRLPHEALHGTRQGTKLNTVALWRLGGIYLIQKPQVYSLAYGKGRLNKLEEHG